MIEKKCFLAENTLVYVCRGFCLKRFEICKQYAFVYTIFSDSYRKIYGTDFLERMHIMELASKQPFSADLRKTARIEATGSFTEGLFGVIAAVFAIIALAGAVPILLGALATIAIGAALFLHGGVMGARYNKLAAFSTENKYRAEDIGGSISVEMLGGIAGIALGIIALFGVASLTLIAAAVVIFGASLILGAGAIDRLTQMVSVVWNDESAKRIAINASRSIMSLQLFVGVGAIVLGVLALIGIAPLTLCLVALLSLGTADFLTGTTVATGLKRAFR
jgi:hypothetical protein